MDKGVPAPQGGLLPAVETACGLDGSATSIPNAICSTFVFRHKTEADARRVFNAIMKRWPFERGEGRRSAVTGWSASDTASAADAARLALESPALDLSERVELALDLLEMDSWAQCQAKFAEWDLVERHGCLEDARAASGMSAGTAETAQQAQGEARQPDPKGDAHE